jgi:type I restriction enzyme R subunit
MLGRDYPEKVHGDRTLSFNLQYIDWQRPERNVYHVTREYAVESATGENAARPDIVLFVNGIPFGVIECKAPTLSENKGVLQHLRNQSADYIPQLYKFSQVLVATNKNAVKYATTGTSKKFWSEWREEESDWFEGELLRCVPDRLPTTQDKTLVSLFARERLLRLVKYFILYDANVKKIARYQQYFAIEAIINTIQTDDAQGNRQGGVIWHTQGSGKSLTMSMLSKYLLEHIRGGRVVLVTDRTELDRQIFSTFSHTRLKPARATSGKNLIDLINSDKADVITAIINKFSTVESSGLKADSRDIFVLVDESHRTNYGSLATKMRVVFPNACYIGFTGTPLMHSEKSTMAKFGKLIHKYTIQDGVDDKEIVPLIYEGRFVEQTVDEVNIDLWFEQITRRLTEEQIEDLKSKWAQLRRITSTNLRIKRIALDINTHFVEGFKNTGFKAMLACEFKRDAVRYAQCLDDFEDLRVAVVISPPDVRESYDDIDEGTDEQVQKFWKKMMDRYGNAETYEETIKNQFVDGEIDILIVCGKLLTGFDAPLTQILYIDKELKEHNLLQAIARTNRIYDGKDFGLIIDYRGLIKKLDDALELYSGAGLEKFDGADIKGVVVDIISSVGKLRENYSRLLDIFSGVQNKADSEEVEVSLEDGDKRAKFYSALCEFGKALAIVINSEKAYEALSKEELAKYKSEFAYYSKIRRSVKIRYADAIDNAEYEPQMQNLLDTHLSIVGLKQITAPVDILNRDAMEVELRELGTMRSKADAIRSSMTKSISEHHDENPVYYEDFSKRIKDALEEYKNRVVSEAEYLNKMNQILDDYRKGVSNIHYPTKIKGNVHAQAFYGVICAILDDVIDMSAQNEFVTDATLKITAIIEKNNYIDWQNNTDIHNRIAQEIDDLFYEYEKQQGIKLDFDVIDKIIENVKTVALRRFR